MLPDDPISVGTPQQLLVVVKLPECQQRPMKCSTRYYLQMFWQVSVEFTKYEEKRIERDDRAKCKQVKDMVTHQSYHPVDLQVSLGRGRSLLTRGCQFLFPVFQFRVLE